MTNIVALLICGLDLQKQNVRLSLMLQVFKPFQLCKEILRLWLGFPVSNSPRAGNSPWSPVLNNDCCSILLTNQYEWYRKSFLSVTVKALAIANLAAILQIHNSHKSRQQFSGIMSLHNNLPSLLENWIAYPQPQNNTYSNLPKYYINNFFLKKSPNPILPFLTFWYNMCLCDTY